ncbi:MAG: hypothetical protein IT381_13900 [Deltaproteobacteria bacterium]|nr:hypothetical protein [Deltaproteobacteria bacterium]
MTVDAPRGPRRWWVVACVAGVFAGLLAWWQWSRAPSEEAATANESLPAAVLAKQPELAAGPAAAKARPSPDTAADRASPNDPEPRPKPGEVVWPADAPEWVGKPTRDPMDTSQGDWTKVPKIENIPRRLRPPPPDPPEAPAAANDPRLELSLAVEDEIARVEKALASPELGAAQHETSKQLLVDLKAQRAKLAAWIRAGNFSPEDFEAARQRYEQQKKRQDVPGAQGAGE